MCIRDSFTLVHDADGDLVLAALHPDEYAACVARELDGVGEQIRENLLQAALAASHSQVPGALEDVAQDPLDAVHGALELELSGDVARYVQEIVDHLDLQPGVALDRVER